MAREWVRGRGFLGALVGLALLLVAGGAARAQDPAGEATADSEAEFSHRHQFGLHVQGGAGYRGVFPYNEEYCGELKDDGTNKSNCLGRNPYALDVGLSYGVTRRLELIAEVRLGLERDIGEASADDEGPHTFAVSPGIKGYFAAIGPTMLFATLQLPVDFTSYGQIDKTDFGVRNINGVQYDFNDNFGFFVFAGEQLTFIRWLMFEVEAGVGLQLRVP